MTTPRCGGSSTLLRVHIFGAPVLEWWTQDIPTCEWFPPQNKTSAWCSGLDLKHHLPFSQRCVSKNGMSESWNFWSRLVLSAVNFWWSESTETCLMLLPWTSVIPIWLQQAVLMAWFVSGNQGWSFRERRNTCGIESGKGNNTAIGHPHRNYVEIWNNIGINCE